MKYLKLFQKYKLNESSSDKKRLSVAEIEDYFLEFLDSGQMSDNAEYDDYFRKNEIIPYVVNGKNQPKIGTQFIINDDLNNVKSRDDLTRYNNLFYKILEVCDRWNLEVTFSQVTRSYMTILQEIPQPIIDNFLSQGFGGTRVLEIVVGDKTLKYFRELSLDENNDFYVIFTNVTPGKDERFDRQRVREYDALQDSVIEYFENQFTVPLQFSEIVSTLNSTNTAPNLIHQNYLILRKVCPDYAAYPKMLKFKILL
jgi:hypothetical protein